nr:MAG TPA: Lysozyme [Crassvirales sp.]
MKDRASYIKLGIENGITDLDAIRGIYNKFAMGGDTRNEELKGSDKTLPKLSLHVDKSTGEGFAIDDNGKIVGRDAATGLSEATVTGKRTWLNRFKKEHLEMAEVWKQMAQDNLQQKTQAGFYDDSYRPTVSKEEAERNKQNYFEVAALNAAMGSPYTMNQNSFNYNPVIANQQLNFGARYPLSSINNAFESALGDAAFNYILKGGKVLGQRLLNSDLRYELDPRYMKVYHHSPEPFDIANFNVATKNDAGLHVSPYPDYNSNFGNVIYKGYVKRPSFEFFDRGSNGYNMFTPIGKGDPMSLLKIDSPLTERYLKAAYSPKSLKKLKFTPLTGSDVQGVPGKYTRKYKVLKFGLGTDNNVDAIDLIFPNESSAFKEDLRKIVNAGIDKKVNARSKYPLSIEDVDNNNIWVNKQVSDFLSSHGYSVGEYPNSNPLEKFPQSFSIFDRNAAHNWKRIRKEGGPLKKSYKDFSTRLSKAWHNQDLSQDDYDYQKYYNDDPEEAYRQLESIEKGGQGHFPDEGRSGIYKTSNHPTYPDLGANSWLNNDRIFNMSARQAVPENTDRVLDYLGYDLGYNKGGTKAMYNGAYQLPEVTITPNGNYTELIPNELGTGWMYRDRAGRFDDFNYDYVNRYEGNQKALGGNLFADGGKKATRYRSSSNIRKQISTWEGATMKTNTPFDEMDTRFNQVLPEGALEKLSQEQLDGLYSFAYNVGTGRFKTRTAPTLAKYLQGNATVEDVKGTMWASGDKKYRGLANRRKKERSMLGAYVPVQETIPMTTPLATPLDITPAVQPIIESNPVIQDNIETLPLAFNTESQKESYYTPGFFDYVNYINQIRQPKQPKQRDRRIWLTI